MFLNCAGMDMVGLVQLCIDSEHGWLNSVLTKVHLSFVNGKTKRFKQKYPMLLQFHTFMTIIYNLNLSNKNCVL